MRTSEQTTDIFAALAQAQAATEAATKDNTNPAFRSRYADLAGHMDVIRPAAKAAKLAVLQELTSDERGVSVVTRIVHASGQWIEYGPLHIPVNKHDAQGFGSAASYARRYALSAAWGTVADDDDGNAAVQAKPVEKVDHAIGAPATTGTYRVTSYRKDGAFHTAQVLGADAQGGAIKVATKLPAVGKVLAQVADGQTECRVSLTMKGRGEAWLNSIEAVPVAHAPLTDDLDESAIPF